MNPSDDVDDFLAKAGAQWRAGQPSAPEPDLDRIDPERDLGHVDRKKDSSEA